MHGLWGELVNDRSYEKPSYFSILPANVRYDNNLKANEKILYSEITALANKHGYCSASNAYFARLYEVTIRAISQWIGHLEKSGYIKTQLIKDKETKKVVERRIYIQEAKPVEQMFHTPRTNVPYPIEHMFQKPMEQKFQENNTSINNTSNKYSRAEHDRADEKIPYKDIVYYLNNKTGKNYKSNTAKTKDLIKARYNEGFTLDDFKQVIDNKVIDWSNNDRMSKYLRPETLFSNKFEGYLNEQPSKGNYQPNYNQSDISADIADLEAELERISSL